MKAQIHNDALGWDAPENAIAANSEPEDPAAIWGNFTKEELPEELGYKLPIGVGHAGDYNGYTVSYREYMGYDEYRKALTSYGPHTADYMVTRLVRLAGELNDGPALAPEPHDSFGQADEMRMLAASTALGTATATEYDAWRAALPDDAGPAEALDQPGDITRFQAATFRWRGGSNAVDNPTVRVERLVDGEWQTFADQSGEVQTKLDFPQGANGFFDTYSGGQEWIWTANFEAFDAFPRDIGSTPSGTYRFVVDGLIRQGGADAPYELTSNEFAVRPWDGITVTDIRADAQGISFDVPAYTYPETYTSEFSYIGKNMDEAGGVPFCETCSFRPWATTGAVESATVTIERKSGATQHVAAQRRSDGSWFAPATLFTGDVAYVDRGGVVDNYGEINGQRSAVIDGSNRRATVMTLKLEQAWSGPTLRVKLVDETGAGVAGRTIAYFADGVRIRSNTTNQNGVTALRIPEAYRSAQVYEARFAGDADYAPSSASVQNS
jgi:hypothetical protein